MDSSSVTSSLRRSLCLDRSGTYVAGLNWIGLRSSPRSVRRHCVRTLTICGRRLLTNCSACTMKLSGGWSTNMRRRTSLPPVNDDWVRGSTMSVVPSRRRSRMLERRYRRTLRTDDRLAWTRQVREMHALYTLKESEYWSSCIDAISSNTNEVMEIDVVGSRTRQKHIDSAVVKCLRRQVGSVLHWQGIRSTCCYQRCCAACVQFIQWTTAWPFWWSVDRWRAQGSHWFTSLFVALRPGFLSVPTRRRRQWEFMFNWRR